MTGSEFAQELHRIFPNRCDALERATFRIARDKFSDEKILARARAAAAAKYRIN